MSLDYENECSIEILSKKCKVNIEENLDAYDEKDTSAIGMWLFEDHTIHLKFGLEMDVAEETLFHEMVHAVENELFLGLSEKKVSALSAVLYDTLKRNGLLKNIFEELSSKKANLGDFPIKLEAESKLSDETIKEGFSLLDLP